MLITSLFPDTPRAANALLSYNNKPVKEAVPLFEEVFSPLFTSISGDRSANGTSALGALSSPTVAMNFALELGRVAVRGRSFASFNGIILLYVVPLITQRFIS